jgi:hypothetical protein
VICTGYEDKLKCHITCQGKALPRSDAHAEHAGSEALVLPAAVDFVGRARRTRQYENVCVQTGSGKE